MWSSRLMLGAVAQVVALVVMTGPLDLVEVLDDEAERILAPAPSGRRPRVAPAGISANLAAAIGVEHRGAHRDPPEFAHGTRTGSTPVRSLAEDEAVVDELFVTAEVDGFVVLEADDETQLDRPRSACSRRGR